MEEQIHAETAKQPLIDHSREFLVRVPRGAAGLSGAPLVYVRHYVGKVF